MRNHIDKRIAAVVAGLGLVAPGSAAAQTLAIQNDADVPSTLVAQMERAAVNEVNEPVHQAYPDTPLIGFDQSDPNAWVVKLVPESQWPSQIVEGDLSWTGAHYMGWHYRSANTNTAPSAIVRWRPDLTGDEYAFSHEVIEMAVDPTGTGAEICDAVDGLGYTLDGVTMALFVRPDGSIWDPPPATTRLSPKPDPTPVAHHHHHHHKRRKHGR